MKKFNLGLLALINLAAGTGTEGGDATPMDEMTEESCIQILNSRTLVSNQGQYMTKVTNVTPYERPEEQGGLLTQINNYDLMTPYNLQEAKRLFNEGKYTEAASQKLSSSSRIGIDFCPRKGDVVNVVVSIIETKNRPEGALLVKAVMPLITEVGTKVRFNPKGTSEVSLVDPATVAETNKEKSIAQAQHKGAEITGKVEEPSLT